MPRALVPLAVAGLVLSALGFQFTRNTSNLPSNFVAPRITQALDESERVVLKGNTHPLARPQYDRGAAPADLPLNRMLLVLKRSPEQETALRQLLDAQQDKSSPNYHKWLTPDEFGKQFGPADQDMQTTTAWLQSHGFQIGNVARGRTVIEFSGNAAQVQEAFGTTIHKYVVNGKQHWANANDPQIPAALGPVVSGVFTMHDFRKKPMLRLAPQPVLAKYVKGQPLTTFGNPPIHALSPADYATIYNINPVYQTPINGGGVTIAVVARSNWYLDGVDIFDFQNVFGQCCSNHNVLLNGPDPGDLGGGEEAEATLDATWSGALARGANVVSVVSASTNMTDGVDLSELYIVDNNSADIMTESFGSCEAAFTQAQANGVAELAEQAAAQGITYFVSSGDAGAEGCDDPNFSSATGPISVNLLASTPFNIAVGGTMFNENGQDTKYWNSTNDTFNRSSARSYIPENAWNESCTTAKCGTRANLAASGGGASQFFGKPSWQSGVIGIPNDGVRDLPDVSLTASGHDAYLLCLQASCEPDAQGFIRIFLIGGTSASAPSFAGIMALVDEKMGGRQGLANYVLYQLAKQNPSTCNGSNTSTLPTSNCIFNDTTVGNNAVPGEVGYGTSTGKYQSGKGYDLATGLGSVNVANLVSKWNSVTFNGTTTTLALNSGSPVNVPHGTPVNVSITVAPLSSSVTPTGDVALLSGLFSTPTPAAVSFFKLSNGVVTTTTNLLPGGSYGVQARYAGDATFASSTSTPPISVTITPETSTTTLQVGRGFDSFRNIIPFAGGPYGSFVYLSAGVAGASGMGIPTGTVNFNNASTMLAAFPLNSAGNTASPNGFYTLAPGSYSIVAQYLGDNSFNASSSGPGPSFTITPALPSTSASYTAATQGATLSAVVQTNSGGAPPSGSVTFSMDGNPVGSPVPVSGKSAVTTPLIYILQAGVPPVQAGAQANGSWLDSALPNGQHTLVASYSGDSNYAASTSAPLAFNLQPDFTLVSSSPTIAIASPGGAGTVNLSISPLDAFTGTVSFSCSGLPAESTCNFAPATVKGSGSTVMTVTTTPPKSSALRYPGNFQLWTASGSLGVAGIFLLGMPARQRRWRKVLSFIAFALFVGVVGCGGGGSNSVVHDPGTATGTYNVTVKASSASLVHQLAVKLVIQ